MDNEARRIYYREYRKKNKERIREINKRYWNKKQKQLEETRANND